MTKELMKLVFSMWLLVEAAKCLHDDKRSSIYGTYISSITKEANVDEPENLTCTVLSSTEINLTWDPPINGTPQYYVIEWTWSGGYENPTPTIETEYNMTDLLPCTRYTINVRSSNGSAESDSAVVRCTTIPPSVPPPPTHVQLTSSAPDKAIVNWEAPLSSCLFVNYYIAWQFVPLWGDGQASGDGEHFTNSGGEKRYIIYDLIPYSNVTACVSAALQDTDFGEPSCTSGNTTQDSPGPPTILNVTQDKGSVEVTWKSPDILNGIIENYTLTWNTAESEENSTVVGNVLSYNLTLMLCETYNLSVSAKTAAEDWGPPSNETEAIILNYLPADKVNCSSAPDGNVTVSWITASSKCLVSGFYAEYNWTSLWSEEQGSNFQILGPESKELVVQDALPYSQIRSCVGVGDKLDNGGCCTTNTAQQPPGPPTILSITQDKGSAVVTWEPPDILNGVIENYLLTWENDDYIENNTAVGNVMTYTIEMQPCQTYNFSVCAKTAAEDWGLPSIETEITMLNYLPADNVNCSSDPDGSVTVSWTTASSKCPVSGFYAEYNWTSLWSEDQGSNFQNLDPESMELEVQDALPYSQIRSCVGVGDMLDNGGCCTTNTAQQLPGPPKDMTYEYITNSGINITWSEPTEINGVLGSWILSINNQDEVLNITLHAEIRSYELVDILSGIEYNVTLQASTGAGFGEAAFCIISTKGVNDAKPTMAVIVGGAIGVLLGLVFIIAAVFVGRKWKTRKTERKQKENEKERQMTQTPQRKSHKQNNEVVIYGTKPFASSSKKQNFSKITSNSYDNQCFKTSSSNIPDDQVYNKPSSNTHGKLNFRRPMSEDFNNQYLKRYTTDINEIRNFRRPTEDNEQTSSRRHLENNDETRNFRGPLRDNDEIDKAKRPSSDVNKIQDSKRPLRGTGEIGPFRHSADPNGIPNLRTSSANTHEFQNYRRLSTNTHEFQNYRRPSTNTHEFQNYRGPSTNTHEFQNYRRPYTKTNEFQNHRRSSTNAHDMQNFMKTYTNTIEMNDFRRPSTDVHDVSNIKRLTPYDEEKQYFRNPSPLAHNSRKFSMPASQPLWEHDYRRFSQAPYKEPYFRDPLPRTYYE